MQLQKRPSRNKYNWLCCERPFSDFCIKEHYMVSWDLGKGKANEKGRCSNAYVFYRILVGLPWIKYFQLRVFFHYYICSFFIQWEISKDKIRHTRYLSECSEKNASYFNYSMCTKKYLVCNMCLSLLSCIISLHLFIIFHCFMRSLRAENNYINMLRLPSTSISCILLSMTKLFPYFFSYSADYLVLGYASYSACCF